MSNTRRKDVFAGSRRVQGAGRPAHDALKPTPFLRAGFWLLACIARLRLSSWRRGGSREAAFRAGRLRIRQPMYVLSFYGVGVASDFRYGYWAVLAAMAGGVVAAVR